MNFTGISDAIFKCWTQNLWTHSTPIPVSQWFYQMRCHGCQILNCIIHQRVHSPYAPWRIFKRSCGSCGNAISKLEFIPHCSHKTYICHISFLTQSRICHMSWKNSYICINIYVLHICTDIITQTEPSLTKAWGVVYKQHNTAEGMAPTFTKLEWRHNERDGILNHQPYECLLNHLFRHRSKKTSNLRVTGLCAGNSPMTVECTDQRARNAENVSIWWRHHG